MISTPKSDSDCDEDDVMIVIIREGRKNSTY